MVDAEHAHVGAATRTALFDRFGGDVEDLHQRHRPGRGAAGRSHQIARGTQPGERESGATAGFLNFRGPADGFEHAGRGVFDGHDEACRELAEWSSGIHEGRRVRQELERCEHALEPRGDRRDVIGARTVGRLGGRDVPSDAGEQLFRRLDHYALVPREVTRAEDLQSIVGQRRRHIRTVRSAARVRNQPPRLAALVIVAVLVLLAVLVARASADPQDHDRADEPGDDGPGDDDVAPVDSPRGVPIGFAVPAPSERLVPPIPVDRVVAAAYRAAGLDDDPTSGWRKRTRLAALVPWVTVRDGREAFWRDVDDPTLEYTDIYDVRAMWRLDRLVFDPNEIRIEAMNVSRRRERRLVSASVIRTYYEWLALRTAAARTPGRWATRADEVLAELDAMTDGWFSQTLANLPRSR